MSRVLVAGATGYLGRHVVAELSRRGHRVRAIVRHRSRAEAPGACSAPPLSGSVDEWAVGDVTDASFTRDIADGVDEVISALGVTRQKADPWEIDNRANLAVLDSALRFAVRSFTYVGVLHGDRCPARLTRAKTTFAQTLTASPMSERIINPTGYFSDMLDVLALARRGLVPLLRPHGRINPIHGADLARFCVDRMEGSDAGSWDVGGPQSLTWRDVALTAFEAAGRHPRILHVPERIAAPALRAVGLFSPRTADLGEFAVWGMVHDAIAPATGTRRLADFFAERTG
ncbi:NAD(P)H-binding protein [Brevibacterium oceani]|uniref:NAD(P)H-binding protein n=1 Tax=Brevibacterium oceani TaxID=358099 RepID=UPI001B329582|nr:NAD(P)H-binding protein [Brevibacterium oceani]